MANPGKRAASIMMLCALASTSALPAHAQTAECKANFTTKGSFISGKTYSTWRQFDSVAPLLAFKRVYTFVVKDGWKINQADKDMGVISASEDVNMSNGKTAPLNVIVEESGKHGSKVTITLSTGFGQIAPHIDDHLCDIINSIDQ